MLIRKSQVQNVLDKTVEKAVKIRDEYWVTEMTRQIDKKEGELILEINSKNSEIKLLNGRIQKLEEKIKTAEKKYYCGRTLIKKARYIVQSIHEEYKEILGQHQLQAQRFKAIETEVEESERSLIIKEPI